VKIRAMVGSLKEVDTQLGADLLWNNFLRIKAAIAVLDLIKPSFLLKR